MRRNHKSILLISIVGMIFLITSCSQRPESYPKTWIDYPLDGASIPLGEPITIISHVFAPEGVAEVVLSVNGEAYRRDVPAEAGSGYRFSLRMLWCRAGLL